MIKYLEIGVAMGEHAEQVLRDRNIYYTGIDQWKYDTTMEHEKNKIKNRSNCDRSISGSMASLTPSALLREQEERATSKLSEIEEKRLRKAKEKQKRE